MKKLIDCVEILDSKRIPLSSNQRNKLEKIYPYYGAQGIIDYVNDYIFEGKYILVAEDGNNLKSQNTNICTWVNGKFWVNNHAHILGKKSGYDLKYIYYYLSSLDLSRYVTGSAQPKLNQDNLAKIELSLPSFTKQKNTSFFLSAIDRKIENNNHIISELESLTKTIYDYWFMQFDFPDENGKPYRSSGGKMVWNDELKREIPEGWRVGTLSDIANFNMGQSPKGQSYNTNSMGYPLINGAAELTKDKIKIEKYTSKANRFSNINDWIFCIRATIGNIQCSDKEYALGRGVASATVKEETFFEYLYFLLNEMCNYYEKILIGSIISGMTREDIINYSCIIPDKRVVSKFHTISKDSFQIIESLKKEDQQLASLRDFLLPLLMNGQVTFRDADK